MARHGVEVRDPADAVVRISSGSDLVFRSAPAWKIELNADLLRELDRQRDQLLRRAMGLG